MNIAKEQEIEKMNEFLSLTYSNSIYIMEQHGMAFNLYNRLPPLYNITCAVIDAIEDKYGLDFIGVHIESSTHMLTALFHKRLER